MKLGYEPANRAKSQMLRFVGRADWLGASGLEARVEVAFIHLIGCCTVNAAPCTSELAAEVLGALPADAFGECHVGGSAEVQVALRDCWEAFVSADMDGQRRRAQRGVLLTKDGGRDFLVREASVGPWMDCGAQALDTFSAVAAYCGRARTDRVPLTQMAAALATACGGGWPTEDVEAEQLREMQVLGDRDESLDFSMGSQLEIGLAEKEKRAESVRARLAGARDAEPEDVRVAWPETEDKPLDFEKRVGFVSCAWPHLFNFGEGDFANPRSRSRKSFAEYVGYLQRYVRTTRRMDDGRAAWFRGVRQRIDSLLPRGSEGDAEWGELTAIREEGASRLPGNNSFNFWACNQMMRSLALQAGYVWFHSNPEFANMTVADLGKVLEGDSSHVASLVQTYTSSICGTAGYWRKFHQRVIATNEQKGLCTYWQSQSLADLQNPYLRALFPPDSDDLSATARLIRHPQVVAAFYRRYAEIFVREIVHGAMRCRGHALKHEAQRRGTLHFHTQNWSDELPTEWEWVIEQVRRWEVAPGVEKEGILGQVHADPRFEVARTFFDARICAWHPDPELGKLLPGEPDPAAQSFAEVSDCAAEGHSRLCRSRHIHQRSDERGSASFCMRTKGKSR